MTLVFSNPIHLYYEDFLMRKYECEQKRMRSKSFVFYLNLITKNTLAWERSPTFDNYFYIWNTFTALALKRSPLLVLTTEEVKEILDSIDRNGFVQVDINEDLCTMYRAVEPITLGARKIVETLSFYDMLFYEYAIHRSRRSEVYRRNYKHLERLSTVTFT